MTKMLKKHLATLAALEAALEAATQAIFAAAHPRQDVRWSECYKMASAEARKAYDHAHSAWSGFRADMVAQGRAYWSYPNNLFVMSS